MMKMETNTITITIQEKAVGQNLQLSIVNGQRRMMRMEMNIMLTT